MVDQLDVLSFDTQVEILLKYLSPNVVPFREALRNTGFDVDNPELVEQPGSVVAIAGIIGSKGGTTVGIDPGSRKLIVLISNEADPGTGLEEVAQACSAGGISLGQLVVGVSFNSTLILSSKVAPSGFIGKAMSDRLALAATRILGKNAGLIGFRVGTEVDTFSQSQQPRLSLGLEVFLADTSRLFVLANFTGQDIKSAISTLSTIRDLVGKFVANLQSD